MFRGSPGLTADQLADIGSIVGGDFNANTREGLTQYLFTVPAEDLSVALHIEALRMRAVLSTEKEWEHERGAIEQEVAQDLSEPGYVLFEKLRARMFAGTPYAHDALGTRPSFEKTTGAMLQAVPRHLVRAQQRDPGHRRQRRSAGDAERGQGALRRHRRQEAAAQAAPDAAPRAADLLHRRHRPARRHAHDRAAHARAARPGFRGARGACGRALQQALRALRAGAAGQGDRRGVRARPAAGSRARLRRTLLHGRRRSEGARRARCARSSRAWRARACRRSWSRRPSCRSAARRSSSATRSPSSPPSGRMRSRSTGSSPRTRTSRASRSVTVADVNRVARKYLDLDHAITGIMLPRGSGAPVSAARGFGGQESISLGEAHPTELPSWAQKALRASGGSALDAASGRQHASPTASR